MGEFLEEDLGKAGGGGLETDFRQLRRIVAAKEIEEVILIQAIFENGFLFEAPFEIAAGGPIGNVTLDKGKAGIVEGGDNVFVWNAVPEHVIDHVALDFGQGSDAAVTAVSALSARGRAQGVGRGGQKGFGVNHSDGLGGGNWRRDEVEGRGLSVEDGGAWKRLIHRGQER